MKSDPIPVVLLAGSTHDLEDPDFDDLAMELFFGFEQGDTCLCNILAESLGCFPTALPVGLGFIQAESAKRVARLASVAANKLRKHGVWNTCLATCGNLG